MKKEKKKKKKEKEKLYVRGEMHKRSPLWDLLFPGDKNPAIG